MKWTQVDQSRAPRPSRQGGTRRSVAFDRLVEGLVDGKVARIELEEGDTLRGLRASITRAAGRYGVRVQVWEHEGDLYAALRQASPRLSGEPLDNDLP